MNWQAVGGVGSARSRAAMLGRLRRYFADQGVLETETPVMVRGTATDPQIESIRVASDGIDVYLHTSPEHAMKRLLASGYPDIFQVCKVFRDGETGAYHRSEFTMVEWYRRGFNLPDIVADSLQLLDTLFEARSLAPAVTLDYRDVFHAATGIDPLAASAGELAGCLDADDGLRESLGEDRNAWLDLAMATRVAPGLPDDRVTAVCHYPAEQAALARLCPQDRRVSDRFELFLGALELANGFVELTDPDEQLARFEAERARRALDNRHVPDVDETLIDALRHGLPECAGVALGLDRVLMIEQGLDDIAATLTFNPGS